MGFPISLSASESALLMSIAVTMTFVEAFSLSVIIGLGVGRLLYVGGAWCAKRSRESILAIRGSRQSPLDLRAL